jgi:hypothetical protein
VRFFYLISNVQVLTNHEYYLRKILDIFGEGAVTFVDLRIDISEALELPESLSTIEVLKSSDYQSRADTDNEVEIFSLPYLEKYSLSNLLESKSKKVYLGYAPLWSHDPRLHFELEFYKAMDFIFTRSINEDLGYQSVGIPKGSIIKVVDPNIVSIISNRDRGNNFLYTPHWTQTWYGYPKGYSSFIWSVHEVLAQAKTHSSKSIVLRPHPFLSSVISDMKMRGLLPESPFFRAIEAWENLSLLPNVKLSDSSLSKDICESDVILTDPSTVMIYMNFTNSDTCICYSKDSPPLSSLGEMALESNFQSKDAVSLRSHLGQDNLGESQDIYSIFEKKREALKSMLLTNRLDFSQALHYLQI